MENLEKKDLDSLCQKYWPKLLDRPNTAELMLMTYYKSAAEIAKLDELYGDFEKYKLNLDNKTHS